MKLKGATSNQIETENVLDELAAWRYSLDNLKRDQAIYDRAVFFKLRAGLDSD